MTYVPTWIANANAQHVWAELIAWRDFGPKARIEGLDKRIYAFDEAAGYCVWRELDIARDYAGVPLRATPYPSGLFVLVTAPNMRGDYEPVQIIEIPDWPEAACSVYQDGKKLAELKGRDADKKLGALLKTMKPAPKTAKAKRESVADLKAEIVRLRAQVASLQIAA